MRKILGCGLMDEKRASSRGNGRKEHERTPKMRKLHILVEVLESQFDG